LTVRIVLITALITVVLGGACAGVAIFALDQNKIDGSGTIITENREVANVRAIDMEGGNYRVVVTRGPQESLSITSDDNIVDELTTEIDGETLEISWGDGNGISAWRVNPTEDVLVELTLPELVDIDMSGSSDIEAAGVTGDALSVSIAGSGDVTLINLDVDTLTVDIEGSGDIDADGTAANQEIDIDGSGRIRADNLAGRTARVDVSGSGDVTLNVSETLDVEINGSGTVEYYGDPQINKDISGSGDLIPLGDAPEGGEPEATPAATPRATPRVTATGSSAGAGTPRAARPSVTPTPED
jgi:hypothetical protein